MLEIAQHVDILSLVSWLLESWRRLPPGTRDRIIDVIVDVLEPIIRDWFRRFK